MRPNAQLVYQIVKRCFTQDQWEELAQSPDFFFAVTQARDAVDIEEVVDLGWRILAQLESALPQL
jgi:hypothetical protein